jgi:hypothetical protein
MGNNNIKNTKADTETINWNNVKTEEMQSYPNVQVTQNKFKPIINLEGH